MINNFISKKNKTFIIAELSGNHNNNFDLAVKTIESIAETGADAVKLIFSPGFSTKDEVDNLSGQGVGMSVIKSHVDNAGGKLNVRSSTGKFCEFRILLHQ